MDNISPIVSVCMITYNHEKYIAEAIDSVLMQKTNFDYEIVIGEDCSTDRTRGIVLEYKAKHPDKIKLLFNEKNVGMLNNFIQTLKACKGKYIALLEGDDYWTDPYKLQKQVDFLEANSDYSFCFHNTFVLDYDTNTEYLFNDDKGKFFKKNLNNSRTVEGWELINNWICPTCSVVFRNQYTFDYSVFENSKYGDIILFLSLAKKGKVFYFNQVFSCYRKLSTGQRKAYEHDPYGKIAHIESLIKNFNDIPFLEIACSKLLSYMTFSYAITNLRNHGFKCFRKNIKIFLNYFIKVLKLKSPVIKLWFIIFIFYKISKISAKELINYNLKLMKILI